MPLSQGTPAGGLGAEYYGAAAKRGAGITRRVVERNYFLDNDEIRVGDGLEITRTADVFTVIDNSDGPDARTIASAEDQSAFDAQCLLDPTLADIELADYFTFQVSSNIGAAPVPLPASLRVLAPVVGLLTPARRRVV